MAGHQSFFGAHSIEVLVYQSLLYIDYYYFFYFTWYIAFGKFFCFKFIKCKVLQHHVYYEIAETGCLSFAYLHVIISILDLIFICTGF